MFSRVYKERKCFFAVQQQAKQGIKESIKGLVLESYVEIKVLETAYTLQIIVILYFPFPV